MARESYSPENFALRVHRVDKRFPLKSAEMETWLGDAVRGRTSWSRSTSAPRSHVLHRYLRRRLFFYAERQGLGGLPVGTSGRPEPSLGGIDSPSLRFCFRGEASVDWFLSATHVGRGTSRPRSWDGSPELSRYGLQSRLFIVPYTHFDLALMGGSGMRRSSSVASCSGGRAQPGSSLGARDGDSLAHGVSNARQSRDHIKAVRSSSFGLWWEWTSNNHGLARRIGTRNLDRAL
jgi:hypothetical protein